jgi:hypothetical protein
MPCILIKINFWLRNVLTLPFDMANDIDMVLPIEYKAQESLFLGFDSSCYLAM